MGWKWVGPIKTLVVKIWKYSFPSSSKIKEYTYSIEIRARGAVVTKKS